MALSVATQTQADRLRDDVGGNVTSMPDSEIDAIWTEAGEYYSTSGPLTAYARVIAIRRLLASSAKLSSYRQNQSSENLSDVYKALRSLLDIWQDATNEAVALAGSGVARFGRTGTIPARIKEYPGS